MEPTETKPVRTHLPNHTSFETAYVVDNYPYGGHRTKMAFWLEYNPRKNGGYRLVSCSLNPKTGRWNAPKPSTYCPIAAMYLDEKGHVQWVGLEVTSSPEKMTAFLNDFPGQCTSVVQLAAKVAMTYYKKTAEGGNVWVVNGVRQGYSEEEIKEAARKSEAYSQVMNLAFSMIPSQAVLERFALGQVSMCCHVWQLRKEQRDKRNRCRESAIGCSKKHRPGWSRLVARKAHNLEVGGSNPPPGPKVG